MMKLEITRLIVLMALFPGTDTAPDTSFSITAKPKLPSKADDVVETNYKVKLNLNFDPIAPINRSFKINIELEGFDAIFSIENH